MNISKNLLSLGLIAVISGISTAQTYTATAGTNGTTDIQSDYSRSTGDGASVSVDVPLEFELPKKVAIAVAENGTKNLPANSLFDGIIPKFITNLSSLINLTPHSASTWNNLGGVDGNGSLYVSGGIYSNNAISITIDMTDFIHEIDSNSQFKCYQFVGIGAKVATNTWNDSLARVQAGNDSTSGVLPATFNIDDSQLAINSNQLSFVLRLFPYLDTINITDRAGKYLSTATFTISTL